ncbi:hypothetical protein C7B65_15160 [Phormidesmis priestleyi ULC007]|uniref:Uncharacterized protein n=1 Tax=Phormidesmis priestleyi ULC007 TaxID=1920490 RepID=A0A2T1DDB8_9CYAN|nr:hypothetical protein [Phormidesmis priestleyi]PSB18431.1 hypothetical protein C7B65_15160 [Phormidesmis priestleyi ULC007]PZO48842.1 MAG: hypothetical protein DCF14_16030 [Phormidesmis priestleyi]
MSALPTKPSAIATTEQELMRLMMYYRDVNPRINWLEEANFTMPIASWDWKPNPEGRILFVARAIIEVDSALLTSGIKPWMAAKEVPGSANLTGNAYTT